MDKDIQEKALLLLEELKIALEQEDLTFYEGRIFQQALQDTLADVGKSTKIDNRLLISLEKFYQTASRLIGLSNLTLTPASKEVFHRYDRFVYEEVKPNLHIYGPIFLGL